MRTTTISSLDFDHDVRHARRAADEGPVIITDKGEPAYVLLRHDLNCRLVGEDPTILELLAQPGGEDLDFDLPRPPSGIFRPGDLS